MNYRDRIFEAHENNQAATCVMLAKNWLKGRPDDLGIMIVYADMLYQMTRYEEAIQIYNDLLEKVFPEHRSYICASLGDLYRYRGDFQTAEIWFQRGIENAPDEASCYIFLGAIQARQGNLQEAEQIHRRALQCSEGSIDEAYHNLGLVLRGQGRYAEAKACFEQAIDDLDQMDAAIRNRILRKINWLALNMVAIGVHFRM